MCHYSYHAHFIFLQKPEKRVAERNKRLKSIYQLGSTGPGFWSNHWKWICLTKQILYVVLDFLSNGGLDHFLWLKVLPKLSKITVTYKKASMVNFEWSKVRKMTINFEMRRVTKLSSLKIYISPVMEKLERSNFESR